MIGRQIVEDPFGLDFVPSPSKSKRFPIIVTSLPETFLDELEVKLEMS